MIHPELGITDFQSFIKASAFVVKANATSWNGPSSSSIIGSFEENPLILGLSSSKSERGKRSKFASTGKVGKVSCCGTASTLASIETLESY